MRKHLTYSNVTSTLCLILVLGGGAAYAAETIGSSDVINESLLSEDVKNNEIASADIANNVGVQSADVRNGTLNDEDVGQGTFVNFAGDIGVVPANDCTLGGIGGINAQGDHLLLTPSFEDANFRLEYKLLYRPDQEFATISTCNRSGVAINDGVTHFNLLVFDAH